MLDFFFLNRFGFQVVVHRIPILSINAWDSFKVRGLEIYISQVIIRKMKVILETCVSTMIGALDLASIQSANTQIPLAKVVAIMALKRLT